MAPEEIINLVTVGIMVLVAFISPIFLHSMSPSDPMSQIPPVDG